MTSDKQGKPSEGVIEFTILLPIKKGSLAIANDKKKTFIMGETFNTQRHRTEVFELLDNVPNSS